jgi:hypothetical protein
LAPTAAGGGTIHLLHNGPPPRAGGAAEAVEAVLKGPGGGTAGIEDHKGHLRVEPSPGGGGQIQVTLPKIPL